jgi:putative DNA primase/helicase
VTNGEYPFPVVPGERIEKREPNVSGDRHSDASDPAYLASEISRLAKLPLLEYELKRKQEAKRLRLGVTALDTQVRRLREENEPNPGQGSKLSLREPVPWPEPVDPAVLLHDIAAAIRRHVVLSDHEADIVALWIVHCYVFDTFQCTPRLAITSPEKRCGKTTLLDVIGCLVLTYRKHRRCCCFPDD